MNSLSSQLAERPLDEQGEIPGDIMPDKLHPGPKGYGIWYEAMAPVLESLMK